MAILTLYLEFDRILTQSYIVKKNATMYKKGIWNRIYRIYNFLSVYGK